MTFPFLIFFHSEFCILAPTQTLRVSIFEFLHFATPSRPIRLHSLLFSPSVSDLINSTYFGYSFVLFCSVSGHPLFIFAGTISENQIGESGNYEN